jgi:hypothetical protein
MKKTKEPVPRFRVGDWVSFLFGADHPVAQIVEDRGPIGYKGRRLYTIRWRVSPDLTQTFDFPEENLEPASASDHENAMKA